MALALVALCVWTPPALAERVRVRAASDPGLALAQGRQQALERALAEAVLSEAVALMPEPPAEARRDALRTHLAPMARQYVQSYQELGRAPQEPQAEQPAQPVGAGPGAAVPPTGAPVEMELDVETNRAALRRTVLRLGFLAGERHPGGYVLRLGPGLSAQEAGRMRQQDLLLGLDPAHKGAELPAVTVERLPQGYFKAVLRQGQLALAADSSDPSALWLDIWGNYFAADERQHGPSATQLCIGGFARADEAVELLHLLSGWDKDVQDLRLNDLLLGPAGVMASFSGRVVNPASFEARLRAVLSDRGLSLAGGTGSVAR